MFLGYFFLGKYPKDDIRKSRSWTFKIFSLLVLAPKNDVDFEFEIYFCVARARNPENGYLGI